MQKLDGVAQLVTHCALGNLIMIGSVMALGRQGDLYDELILLPHQLGELPFCLTILDL